MIQVRTQGDKARAMENAMEVCSESFCSTNSARECSWHLMRPSLPRWFPDPGPGDVLHHTHSNASSCLFLQYSLLIQPACPSKSQQAPVHRTTRAVCWIRILQHHLPGQLPLSKRQSGPLHWPQPPHPGYREWFLAMIYWDCESASWSELRAWTTQTNWNRSGRIHCIWN